MSTLSLFLVSAGLPGRVIRWFNRAIDKVHKYVYILLLGGIVAPRGIGQLQQTLGVTLNTSHEFWPVCFKHESLF